MQAFLMSITMSIGQSITPIFVNPLTGTHTQQTESLWSQMKRMMREERTMNSQLFETYLPEFMWRKKFHSKPFSNFLSRIKEQYTF